MLIRLAAAGARGETLTVQKVDWQYCMRRSWNARKDCANT